MKWFSASLAMLGFVFGGGVLSVAVAGTMAFTPDAAGFGPFSDNDNNGWAFTADSAFQVDGLSAYDVGADGFGGNMLVTFWNHSTATLLASATIPSVGDGTLFPTVAITPLTLTPGVEYSVAAGRVDLSSELWDRWPNSDVTFFAPVSNARQVYGSSAGVFPGTSSGLGYTTAGGSFTFIPEPSTLVLLSVGAMSLLGYAWRRRRMARA